MEGNKRKDGNEDSRETTETKREETNGDERAPTSTTVVASRRTLHSKVSTQRACRERRRAVEVPPPSASWSPPPCQPACLPTAAPQ